MNYILGRPSEDRDVRQHLARCRKCQTRMASLEKEIQTEALELQEQRATFALQNKSPSKQAAG